MRVLLVLGAALVVPRSHASFVTLAPILKDSYICLHDSANENMCVGFSPGVNTNESDTTGQTLWGQQLQMKRRDRNAAQGSECVCVTLIHVLASSRTHARMHARARAH